MLESETESCASKQELVEDLKKLAEAYPDFRITRNFYRENANFREAEWQRHFPSFLDFCTAATIEHSKKTPTTPQEPTLDEQSEILHYKARAQSLEASFKSLLKERGKNKAFIDDLKTAVIALDPYPREWFVPEDVSGTPVAAVVKLSDWQIGEVINPDETEGFGEFNFAVAERRAFMVVQKVLDWVEMHRKAGYNIQELHVFSEGDLVSGNIHYELEVTNEFPVTVAAVKAGQLMAEVIAQFAPHFNQVIVWEMSADNHGRLTRKSQCKQGALNNYSYIAHELCNEMLSKHENVTPIMGQGVKLLADVLGKKFLISHGHHVMGQAGIPFYGFERDKAREAVKRAHTPEKMFDYISMGHWHVPSIIGSNTLINGSLTGTTEFDHHCGRHASPSQVSFMVHPLYGLFDWVSWKLD